MAYQGKVAGIMISVCILFHEKPDQTIECVESFLPSGCPIYVLNNGSSTVARKRFADWNADSQQVRLFDVPNNLGVSGGRNVLIRQTSEDWLFFIDNDIVVNTPDWLERVAQHVDQGAEVLIPRLYNQHEGRFVEYKRIEIVGNRAQFTHAADEETNNFPGGAALISRVLFTRLGYYDEKMFVGGEDFELALRGILAGDPVRARLVPDIELIHDHRPVHRAEDVQAVHSRYDKKRISHSYEWIRIKHGIIMVDDWEEWVDQQVRKQIDRPLLQASQMEALEATCRPRIALVVDVPDWAFHNIAISVMKFLGNIYHFTLIHFKDFYPDLDRAARELFGSSFDLVHFFCREGVLDLFTYCARNREKIPESVIDGFIKTPITFSIYDHCFLSPREIGNFRMVFNGFAAGYSVSSSRLDEIYRNIPRLQPPTMVIEDGVDFSLFSPNSLERLSDINRTLMVGWAGNSRWGMAEDGRDHKGLHTIVKPAIAALQKEVKNVAGRFADSSVKRLPHTKMNDYYNSIDIFICASDQEGTPNPVLEAMACGLPVISTDVGVLPQVFGPKQQQFIVAERSMAAVRDKLRLLLADPSLRRALSEENLERIIAWSRENESQKWRSFFSNTLASTQLATESSQLLICSSQELKRFCFDLPFSYKFEQTVYEFLDNSLTWKMTAPIRKLHYHFLRAVRRSL